MSEFSLKFCYNSYVLRIFLDKYIVVETCQVVELDKFADVKMCGFDSKRMVDVIGLTSTFSLCEEYGARFHRGRSWRGAA